MTLTALTVVTLLAAPAVHAGDTYGERLAAATRYAEVADVESMIHASFDELVLRIPDGKRVEFLEFMRANLRIELLERTMISSMARIFTADELNALADFYGSEVGQAALAKFGAYMAEVSPLIEAETKYLVRAWHKR